MKNNSSKVLKYLFLRIGTVDHYYKTYDLRRDWTWVLWGLVWANVKLNCSLYPFVFYFLSIGAWVT